MKHEDEPVRIIKTMVGDTVDANMFWLPSQKLLIPGDAVYHWEMHLWLADMNTAALSNTWLKTLDFIKSSKPSRAIPGHAASLDFNSVLDFERCAKYVRFFQANIARRGPSYFTPDQITQMLVHAFPSRLDGPDGWSSGMFVNQTAGKFGRDSGRAPDILDMNQFNNVTYLQNWDL